ncbi:MAG: hypothetical protein ACE5IW_07255 [bacterium]
MNLFQFLNKEKLLAFSRRPVSFRMACCLSVLLHGLIFLFMAFLLVLFDVPNLYEPPLVFDFVFMPTTDYEEARSESDEVSESSEQTNEQPNNLSQESEPEPEPSKFPVSKKTPDDLESKIKMHSSSSELSSKEAVNQDGYSDTQPVTLSENAYSSDELSDPSYVPEQESLFDFNRPFLISTLKPSTLNLPRRDISKPKPLPAKISMSPRQRKVLLKKVHKLLDKLHKLKRADSIFVWEDKKQVFEVRLHRKPAKTTTGLDELILEVTTEEDGHTLSTEMRMRRLAFSNFAQFVDYWDPRVAVHDDVLQGRFHTNTVFNVSRSRGIFPKFYGKVTTAAYDVRTGGNFPIFDEQSVFLGGIETGVKEIRLPKTFLPFANDTDVDSSRVHNLTENSWITFHRDGFYSWKTESAPESEHRQAIPEKSFFIVGGKKAELHLKGVLRGKVLVYAAKKIIIDDNLLYARHPEVSVQADDYLGLVSEKDIEIAHPSVTGPGDLHIFASIYAKRRFRVRHLRGKGEATLYVYGSLTAGSLSATEPRYATQVRFDRRLENRRPPNFPMTDRYEMTEWDALWRVKKP